jgi:integrase
MTAVKRTTETSDLKKASILRDRWVSDCRDRVSAYRKEDPTDFKVRSLIEEHRKSYPSESDDEIYDLALDVFDSRDGQAPELEAAARALGQKIVFSDHIDDWRVWASKSRKPSTVDTWTSYLKTFTKRMPTPDEITMSNLLRASDEAGQGLSAQKGTVSAVKSLLKYLVKKVVYDGITTAPLTYYITAETYHKVESGPQLAVEHVLEASEGQDPLVRDLIWLGAYSGRRCVVLSNLRTEEVDLEARLLVMRYDKGLKGGRTEAMPYHDTLHELLKSRVAMSAKVNSKWLFHEYAYVENDTTKRSSYCNKMLNNFLHGLEAGFTFHGFRHKVITEMTNLGINPELRKALAGHKIGKDVHTTTYFHGFDPEVLRPEINKLKW